MEKRGRTIRILVGFLFLFGLLYARDSYGQQEWVTMKYKDALFAEVISDFQKQTGMKFLYNTEKVKNRRCKEIDLKNVSAEAALSIVLRAFGFTYSFVEGVVVVNEALVEIAQDQMRTVTGKVIAKTGEPLPGVTVMLKGTKIGVSSDVNGTFNIMLPQGEQTLVFSFVGMETKEVKYTENKPLVVVLVASTSQLDEVVVTGYQSIRRGDIVGSYSSVKAEDIMMPAYSSIDQMLQGRLAGVLVMNTSSRVGTSPQIRVRGTSTILGNQDPLWVVDGIIQPDPLPFDQNDAMVNDLKNIVGNQISWLNPADIETITVLKDASATAIYGSKAANGVIVITTKQGQSDRMTINYGVTFSFRARPNYGMFDLMNSAERIQFSREAFNAGAVYGSVPLFDMNTYEGVMQMLNHKMITVAQANAAVQKLEQVNTDWFKLLTRNSFSHNHNLSMYGGNSKMTYSFSLGYNDQEGVEKNNDAKNLSARLNLGINLHRNVHVNVSLTGSINETTGYAADVNPMDYATNTSRSVLAQEDNGEHHFLQKQVYYPYVAGATYLKYNILNEMEHSYSNNKSTRLNGAFNFSWDIFPGLKYEFVGGVNVNNGLAESYAGEQTYYVASRYRGYDYNTEAYGSARYKAAMLPYGGELYNSESDISAWNIQNKFTFAKTFHEDHRINVLIGTEVRSTVSKSRAMKTFGYIPERGETVVEPTPIAQIVPTNPEISVSDQDWGILKELYNGGGWNRTMQTSNEFSLFATAVYTFKNRYVFNGSIRNDASNRFGQDQNKRFDPTYSLGVSWNIAQEPWLAGLNRVLNQFTVRASYGVQGNSVNSVSPELILSRGDAKKQYGSFVSSVSQIPNRSLSWERTKSWNLGLDIQLMGWFTMNLEYYSKRSNNIVSQDIGEENGVSTMKINGGRIVNSGVDYSLNITPIRTKDWGWTIGLNASKNWNEAKTEATSRLEIRDFVQGSTNRVLRKGYALSAFWSYSYKGLNHDTGMPEFNNIFLEDANGNVLRDKDGNPRMVAHDDLLDYLVYSGKTEPDFSGGITTRLRWKGLVLGANFSLLIGAKKRLPNPFPADDGLRIPLSDVNMNRELLKRWKQPGDEKFTDIPAVYSSRNYLQFEFPDHSEPTLYYMWARSDRRVVNSSFLRCQQISLTWNVNEAWCAYLGMKSLSVNAIMNNVFVLASKRFHGFDPELGDSVQPKTYSVGINIGF